MTTCHESRLILVHLEMNPGFDLSSAWWLAGWHSGPEVVGSHSVHATILLGSTLGCPSLLKLPPQSSQLQETGVTEGRFRTGPI